MSLPLGRVLREWRRVLIPVAALVLLNLGLHLFVIYPASLRADAAERRADRARQTLDAARQEHALAQDVVKSSRDADKDLERFYGAVLPAHLAAARRMTYTRLAQLARETNLLYDRRSFEPDAKRKGELDRLRITMELEGDYRDVREFIYRLESAPEFVVIEQVTLDRGDEEDAPLILALQLATYFRGADDGS